MFKSALDWQRCHESYRLWYVYHHVFLSAPLPLHIIVVVGINLLSFCTSMHVDGLCLLLLTLCNEIWQNFCPKRYLLGHCRKTICIVCIIPTIGSFPTISKPSIIGHHHSLGKNHDHNAICKARLYNLLGASRARDGLVRPCFSFYFF